MIKFVIIAILCVVAFSTGWMTNGWRHDSIALAAEIYADKIEDAYKGRESKIAIVVEAQLQDIRIHEVTTIREMQPIINRTVYKEVCIDDDGLNIINGMLPEPTTKLTAEPAVTID